MGLQLQDSDIFEEFILASQLHGCDEDGYIWEKLLKNGKFLSYNDVEDIYDEDDDIKEKDDVSSSIDGGYHSHDDSGSSISDLIEFDIGIRNGGGTEKERCRPVRVSIDSGFGDCSDIDEEEEDDNDYEHEEKEEKKRNWKNKCGMESFIDRKLESYKQGAKDFEGDDENSDEEEEEEKKIVVTCVSEDEYDYKYDDDDDDDNDDDDNDDDDDDDDDDDYNGEEEGWGTDRIEKRSKSLRLQDDTEIKGKKVCSVKDEESEEVNENSFQQDIINTEYGYEVSECKKEKILKIMDNKGNDDDNENKEDENDDSDDDDDDENDDGDKKENLYLCHGNGDHAVTAENIEANHNPDCLITEDEVYEYDGEGCHGDAPHLLLDTRANDDEYYDLAGILTFSTISLPILTLSLQEMYRLGLSYL